MLRTAGARTAASDPKSGAANDRLRTRVGRSESVLGVAAPCQPEGGPLPVSRLRAHALPHPQDDSQRRREHFPLRPLSQMRPELRAYGRAVITMRPGVV